MSTVIFNGHMNTIVVNQVHGRRQRRQYSAQFKRDVVAACSAPGVSMAAVALANGLNANLLRRWVSEHEAALSGAALAEQREREPVASLPGFVPLQLSAEPAAAQEIKLELRSGAILISVTWPVSAASECAAWVAAVLR